MNIILEDIEDQQVAPCYGAHLHFHCLIIRGVQLVTLVAVVVMARYLDSLNL